MQELLDEILVMPGVVGTCIFDKTSGMICRKLSAELPNDITNNVGINFIRLLQMAGMNKLKIKSVHFRFDKYWLLGIPLDKGNIILTICNLQANCSLIASTATMLAKELDGEQIKSKDLVEEEGGQDKVEIKLTENSQNEETEKLTQHYGEIENALKTAIGPVAKMVMEECIDKWTQDGPASRSRLRDLMNILEEEIKDPGLVVDFQAKLKHLL